MCLGKANVGGVIKSKEKEKRESVYAKKEKNKAGSCIKLSVNSS